MKADENPEQAVASRGLVDAVKCLEILFPHHASRPSLRWFREMQAKRLIPFRKIGRFVYFDADEVRRALDRQFTIHPKP